MKKFFNNGCVFFITVILGLFIFPSIVNAERYVSDFIEINDSTYSYVGEDFSLSEVFFSKSISNYNGLTSYGTLFGKMVNTSE